MKRILVTGANGFVGSHLVNTLKENNRVYGTVHNGITGRWQHESLEGVTKIDMDIRDTLAMHRVVARYQIDQIYHLAALPIVKTAHADPINTFDVNVMGTVSVLEAARKNNVDRVVVMCTDKVYGEGQDMDEFIPFTKYNEPYGASKVCQAVVVGSYTHTYEMDIAMLHSCNIYGYDPYNNRIVPNVVKECLRGVNPMIYTNDPSVREYIFVEDIVNALYQLMRNEGSIGSFNASSGDVLHQEQMVLEILKHFPGISPDYGHHLDIPVQLDIQSLKSKKWDWKPTYSLQDGLKQTIQMFRDYAEDWT
jgi:nucleoside-diphosphate-sugar epimerase